MPRHLLIVDDDQLSREVFALVAAEAGFTTTLCDCGEAALAHLALGQGVAPSALLVDMQMPGLAGDPLARRLRPSLAPGTLVVAMSGSPVAAAQRQSFDSFLLKPFSFDQFLATLAGAPEHPEAPPVRSPAILDQTVYQTFAGSMTAAQTHQLYRMCLVDAAERLARLREAAKAHDTDAYVRAAHAIKGACGMLGAFELASLAAAMERDGVPLKPLPVDQLDPFEQFEAAAARLQAMLDAQP